VTAVRFEDWEKQQMRSPKFRAVAREPGINGILKPSAFDDVDSAREQVFPQEGLAVAVGRLAQVEVVVLQEAERQAACSAQREVVRRGRAGDVTGEAGFGRQEYPRRLQAHHFDECLQSDVVGLIHEGREELRSISS